MLYDLIGNFVGKKKRRNINNIKYVFILWICINKIMWKKNVKFFL